MGLIDQITTRRWRPPMMTPQQVEHRLRSTFEADQMAGPADRPDRP
jgi:hypothetical protein